ncbi:conserved hypothetical protein [Ricinus communis]|uniref:Uncharacterized protein n=1 Tax=Ricinus communis TaxID=3988 RepID=B9RU84_RICCO|nr:conserved hypothetical protein [Ricinus communis]
MMNDERKDKLLTKAKVEIWRRRKGSGQEVLTIHNEEGASCLEIRFEPEDIIKEKEHHNDAMVIQGYINDYTVRKITIDDGNVVNLIALTAYAWKEKSSN